MHAKEYKITNLQYTRPHELEADLQEDKLAPQRPLELHTIRIQNNKLRYFRGNFKDTVLMGTRLLRTKNYDILTCKAQAKCFLPVSS